MSDTLTVDQILKQAADTYLSRNTLYGDSYKIYGKVMEVLFPNGITLNSTDDFNRFGVLSMLISKLTRYTSDWRNPHLDSTHDSVVYYSMLHELDVLSLSDKED